MRLPEPQLGRYGAPVSVRPRLWPLSRIAALLARIPSLRPKEIEGRCFWDCLHTRLVSRYNRIYLSPDWRRAYVP